MKKILLFTMLFVLASCANNKNHQNAVLNENGGKITEENTADLKNNNNTSNNNVDNSYWKKYEKRFKNFAEYLAGFSDEYKRVNEILDISCKEMCDLHIKDNFTKKQLEAANKCYKKCKKMQQDAKAKQKILKKEVENKKNQYPKKCISDAEKKYESFIKEMKERKNQADIPGDFKIPQKEKFVKFNSERCLVAYGYVSRNCDIIKDYKDAYDRCKRVIELESDIFFIEMWRGKTLEDFIVEINRFR